MISARRVTYVSVQNNAPNSVITAAETWGALKTEFPDIGARAQGMKAHIRETAVDLTHDGQQLPTSDFTVYFLLEKNKSGVSKEVEVAVEEYLNNILPLKK